MHVYFRIWIIVDYTLKYNFDSVFSFRIYHFKKRRIPYLMLTTILCGLNSYSFKLFLHTACCIEHKCKYIHEALWRISVYACMYIAAYVNYFVYVC